MRGSGRGKGFDGPAGLPRSFHPLTKAPRFSIPSLKPFHLPSISPTFRSNHSNGNLTNFWALVASSRSEGER